jgi:phage shock protein A
MEAEMTRRLTGWHFLILTVIFILTVLAWSGQIDTLSEDYVDQALLGAGVIYGTARGINALVSVLQGTELDVVMLTFTIGELLDPVNDLIERFSGIILIALGSLAIQKILLGVLSHSVFNILITLLALCTGVALLTRKEWLYRLLLRSFIIVAFFRFSLGLVVLANNQVDTFFFEQDDMRRHVAMQNFEGELRQISTMAGINGPSEELIKATAGRIASLEQTRISEQKSLQQQESELQQAQKYLYVLLEHRPLIEKLNPFSKDSPAIAEAKQQVIRLEAEMESTMLTLESIDQSLEKQRENLACMRKREAGEACSFLQHITSKLSPTEIGIQINALQDRVADFAENTIALLMSALLKSVVIPLLFFYILIKIAGLFWASTPR